MSYVQQLDNNFQEIKSENANTGTIMVFRRVATGLEKFIKKPFSFDVEYILTDGFRKVMLSKSSVDYLKSLESKLDAEKIFNNATEKDKQKWIYDFIGRLWGVQFAILIIAASGLFAVVGAVASIPSHNYIAEPTAIDQNSPAPRIKDYVSFNGFKIASAEVFVTSNRRADAKESDYYLVTFSEDGSGPTFVYRVANKMKTIQIPTPSFMENRPRPIDGTGQIRALSEVEVTDDGSLLADFNEIAQELELPEPSFYVYKDVRTTTMEKELTGLLIVSSVPAVLLFMAFLLDIQIRRSTKKRVKNWANVSEKHVWAGSRGQGPFGR